MRIARIAYGDFTLERVASVLGVTTGEGDLFPGAPRLDAPPWLAPTLGRRTQLALISEKSRSEFIVVPILLASRELSPVPLAIHSGHRLDIAFALGLTGEGEFILAAAPPVAQMVAVRLFNEAAGRGGRPVHGCVTTGEVWQFLRLYEKVALIDRRRYYLDDVVGILSGFQAIIASGAG